MQNRKVTRIHTKKAATLRSMGSLVVHGSPAPRDDGLVRGRPLEVERRHDHQRHEDEHRHDGRRHQRVVVVPAAAHGVIVERVVIVAAGAGRQCYFCNMRY